MAIDFRVAIEELGGDAGVLQLANEARTPADYLLATILPERRMPGWEATAGSMTIRTLMANMIGMDSTPPEGGAMSLSTFREQLAKFGIAQTLTEAMLRTVLQLVERAMLDGGDANAVQVQTVLNFVNKLLLQPHYDREEWLRGLALFTGEITWTNNGIELALDYGIPAANIFDTRTGNDGYGGSSSVFWADYVAARRILRNNIRAVIGDTATVDAIVYNEANTLEVVSQTNNTFTLRRLVGSGVNQRPSTNALEVVTLIAYDGQGEVRDPDDPNATVKVDFIPTGTLGIFARNDANREFRIDDGSTADPENDVELGWTQLGPTIENGGRLGRFARVYTPERMPMQLRGESFSNSLPVIRNPEKIVILSTDLPA